MALKRFTDFTKVQPKIKCGPVSTTLVTIGEMEGWVYWFAYTVEYGGANTTTKTILGGLYNDKAAGFRAGLIHREKLQEHQ